MRTRPRGRPRKWRKSQRCCAATLGFCQRFVVGKCDRGEACRYKHTPVPAADVTEFRKACAAKFANSGADSSSEPGSPTKPGSLHRSGVGLCRNWQNGVHCSAMPNCKWRHGHSVEEHARVKALRQKEKGKGKGKGLGSTVSDASSSAAAIFIGRQAA